MAKKSRKHSTKRKCTTRKSNRKKSIKRSMKKKSTQKRKQNWKKRMTRDKMDRRINKERKKQQYPVYTVNNIGDLKVNDIIRFTHNNKQVILYISKIEDNIITGILLNENHWRIQKKLELYEFDKMSNIKILTRLHMMNHNIEGILDRPIAELQLLPHEME
jgi:hypothetical protein